MRKNEQNKGAVVMEYVIVLVFIGAVLAVTSTRLFYSYTSDATSGDPRSNPSGFGAWGQEFVGFYQRTAGGLSLPVP